MRTLTFLVVLITSNAKEPCIVFFVVKKKKYLRSKILFIRIKIKILYLNPLSKGAMHGTEAESKEKYSVWDPMPELSIISPYVDARVDSDTFNMGNPMPESTLTLCQSRLHPPVRGLGLWAPYTKHAIYCSNRKKILKIRIYKDLCYPCLRNKFLTSYGWREFHKNFDIWK
jgi:hypothetical protein